MSKNKAFKQTPIPYKSKNGEPMAYYVVSENGNEVKVSRAECLARPEETDDQYIQRWFIDEESGLVVRLPRNEIGETVARENMRLIWREDKHQERKFQCVWKGTKNCDQNCERCDRKHKSRTVELDALFQREDGGGSEAHLELADSSDIVAIAEGKALLDTLYAALAALTQDDRDLMLAIYRDGKTERQLAPELGLKEPKSVNKRKHRILEILRNNEDLKGFFE